MLEGDNMLKFFGPYMMIKVLNFFMLILRADERQTSFMV